MADKQTTLTPVRVRGRKIKRQEEIDAPRRARRDPSSAALKRRKTAHAPSTRLSYLESLPAELIEQIFLECLEFNLPRASPRLGAFLSREPLYRALILYALWHDPLPDESARANREVGGQAIKAVRRMFRPLRYTPISLRDRYSLQLAIWDCRWCTFDRIRGYLRDFTKLSLNRWLYGRGKHVDGLQIDPGDLDAIVAGLENLTFYWEPDLGPEEAAKVNFIDCEITLSSFIFGMDYPGGFVEHVSSIDDPFYEGQADFRPIKVVVIPDKLLTGNPSWTDERIAFLAFLRGYVRVAGSTDFDYELMAPGKIYEGAQLHKGIQAAIIEHNPRALRQLLELGTCFSIKYPAMFDDAERTFPSDHYLTAIDHSEDPTMVKLLIRAATRAIPRDNARFTAWAMRLEERGDPFGRWLLDFMAYTFYSDRFDGKGIPISGSDDHELWSVFGHYPRTWLDEMRPITDRRVWRISSD